MNVYKGIFRLLIALGLGLPLSGLAESTNATLSFAQAWLQLEQNNPDLSAVRAQANATKGAILKAATRRNPELSMEVENFAGSGRNSGWDAAETTLTLQQPLETGGKRRARTAEARAGNRFSQAELECFRLGLRLTLVERFTDALKAAELEQLAEDNARLATARAHLVARRVEAGKAAPPDASRAKVESELAGLDRNKARRQTHLARQNLAVLLGVAKPDFVALQGRLDWIQPWQPAVTSGTNQPLSPLLIKAEQELALRKASLQREKAEAYPDIVLSAGVRRFEESADTAWVGGLTVPLPIFDRNRGGIEQSRQEMTRAESLLHSATLEQHHAQAELHVTAENTWEEIVTLRDKALPTAHDAMEKARAGYEQGKFTYLDWIDAEHSYLTLRTRWIETLAVYHKTVAAIGNAEGTLTAPIFFKEP